MEIGRDGEVDCRWVGSLMVIPRPNAFQTLLVYIYIYFYQKNIYIDSEEHLFLRVGQGGKGILFH